MGFEVDEAALNITTANSSTCKLVSTCALESIAIDLFYRVVVFVCVCVFYSKGGFHLEQLEL